MTYGTGHINDTFASSFRTDRGVMRYIHQRINHHIFREPEQVMANIVRVTRYAAERIAAAGGDPARETLTVIPAPMAGPTTAQRTAITGAPTSSSRAPAPTIRSKRCGTSTRRPTPLANSSGCWPGCRANVCTRRSPTSITLPKRFDAFVLALKRDAHNRAATARAEIDFILARADDAPVVVDLLAQAASLSASRITTPS